MTANKPIVIDIYRGDPVEDFALIKAFGIGGVIHKASEATGFADKLYGVRRKLDVGSKRCCQYRSHSKQYSHWHSYRDCGRYDQQPWLRPLASNHTARNGVALHSEGHLAMTPEQKIVRRLTDAKVPIEKALVVAGRPASLNTNDDRAVRSEID
jgi:hypothetical protein